MELAKVWLKLSKNLHTSDLIFNFTTIKFDVMPKIFEYFGFIFFFYSNEHEPIHVHVIKGETDAVFDIILENGLLKEVYARKGKRGVMSDKDQKTAETFVRKYYKNIVEKWIKFFVLKKAVRSTKITKKI